MNYFPDNTTSSFKTELPIRVNLEGRWEVALSEIQFPCNFLHIQPGEGMTFHYYGYDPDKRDDPEPEVMLKRPQKYYIDLEVNSGVYYDIDDLVDAVNAKCRKQRTHVAFRRDVSEGGKIVSYLSCSSESCSLDHYVHFSDKLERIFGFDTHNNRPELLKYDVNKPDEIPGFPTWFLQKQFRSLSLYNITHSRNLVSDLPPFCHAPFPISFLSIATFANHI